MKHTWLLLVGVAAGAGWHDTRASDAADVPALTVAPPAAQWVQRSFEYTYSGFTDKFSCDGLRDTVRDVLLALGARKQDLQIRSQGCIKLEGPETFPGVSAHFSVLVPVTPDEIGKVGRATANPTKWKTVDLVRLTQDGRDAVPCELLEQLKTKALPLFTTRNLQFSSSCYPHAVTPGEIKFTVDVLQPAAKTPAAGAAPAPAA